MTSYSPPLWRGWGRVCFLVFYLIVLQLPLAESLQGLVAHHAMDGNGTVFVWFLYLPVYEVIAKAYVVGILLGIAVKDGANPCPVEGRKTHGAWLARSVADAPLQLEVPHLPASLAYGAHLGMSSWIVIGRHTVGTRCHHLAILHYYGTERSASVLHILHAQVYCHLHEPAVSIRYLCHRHCIRCSCHKTKIRKKYHSPVSKASSSSLFTPAQLEITNFRYGQKEQGHGFFPPQCPRQTITEVHEERNANKWHIRAQKSSSTCQYMDIYSSNMGDDGVWHLLTTTLSQ